MNSQHAIVRCADALQDRGTVIQVGQSLLTSFGAIMAPVVAHGVIRDADSGNVYYLIENAPLETKEGDSVRISLSIRR